MSQFTESHPSVSDTYTLVFVRVSIAFYGLLRHSLRYSAVDKLQRLMELQQTNYRPVNSSTG